jgi:RNA polymerase sigma-70 factor (ECF subfamily)
MTDFAPELRVSNDDRRDGLVMPSDEDLLDRVARGQHHAFDLIVARYGARLHGFLRHLLTDADEAEDVAQDVLVKVLLHSGDRDPSIRFAVWLFCIARREALDHLRRRRSRARIVAAIAAIGSGMSSFLRSLSPSRGLEADEFRRDLEHAISRLPPEQREVFLLREREGLEYDEIADVLEIPAKTVSTRLFRARERLREALRRHLDGGSTAGESMDVPPRSPSFSGGGER